MKKMVEYNKNSPESIQAMFSSIAKSYDRTNSLLSFQLHRYWNRSLVKETIANSDGKLADLCCGTGEITLRWLKKAPLGQTAYLIDFCPDMLECAKVKTKKLKYDLTHRLFFVQADVQELPLETNSMDFMTIAYGIRNVKNPLKCFEEAFRALKVGGTLGILELTEPKNCVLRFGHYLYLKTILPSLGKLLTSNRQAYNYLSQSIGAFIQPQEVAIKLRQASFRDVRIIPLSGGIATLIIAKKLK